MQQFQKLGIVVAIYLHMMKLASQWAGRVKRCDSFGQKSDTAVAENGKII
jgi:hypothetical protein